MSFNWVTGLKKEKRRTRKEDMLTAQVREVLTKADQQLILMVRQ